MKTVFFVKFKYSISATIYLIGYLSMGAQGDTNPNRVANAPELPNIHTVSYQNPYYTVKAGDTLSRIARDWGRSTGQSSRALTYRVTQWLIDNNTKALTNNGSELIVGAALYLPTPKAMGLSSNSSQETIKVSTLKNKPEAIEESKQEPRATEAQEWGPEPEKVPTQQHTEPLIAETSPAEQTTIDNAEVVVTEIASTEPKTKLANVPDEKKEKPEAEEVTKQKKETLASEPLYPASEATLDVERATPYSPRVSGPTENTRNPAVIDMENRISLLWVQGLAFAIALIVLRLLIFIYQFFSRGRQKSTKAKGSQSFQFNQPNSSVATR